LTNEYLQRYGCIVSDFDVNKVRAVRALAHPLRLQLLDLLRFEGPSTATLLAGRVGDSSGATSYHLRQLARYGYVEETPQRRGRERWWRYRERQMTMEQGRGDASGRTLLAELLSREAHALDRFLAERAGPREWDDAAFFYSQAFRLTALELDQLRRGIEALLSPLRPADANNPPPDAKPVRLLAFGFALPLEKP
jgi:DNA-binding transcriptional ArsR family regulator